MREYWDQTVFDVEKRRKEYEEIEDQIRQIVGRMMMRKEDGDGIVNNRSAIIGDRRRNGNSKWNKIDESKTDESQDSNKESEKWNRKEIIDVTVVRRDNIDDTVERGDNIDETGVRRDNIDDTVVDPTYQVFTAAKLPEVSVLFRGAPKLISAILVHKLRH